MGAFRVIESVLQSFGDPSDASCAQSPSRVDIDLKFNEDTYPVPLAATDSRSWHRSVSTNNGTGFQ